MKKILLLIFLLSGASSFSQSLNSKDVLAKMLAAMNGVNTCSFVLDIQERIKGEFKYDEYVVKVRANPYQVYVYSVTPNPGAEGILIKGENNNKALINPNRFPFVNLNLSPYSMMLRKNHQYTLWHFGFTYIHDVLKGYMNKYGNTFFTYLHLEADVVWKGKNYFQVVIENTDFHYENYMVKPGETMVSIGEKLMVNDYMILEANPGFKHFDDVRAGNIIKVPSAFGKKIILYVDKTTFLPMVQIIYDEKGLYGRVELTSFILNPGFTEEDFSKSNKKYGF